MMYLLVAISLAQVPTFSIATATETKTGPWPSLDKSSLAKLISIHRETLRPAWPRGSGAILVNGDRIPGEFLLGDDTSVYVKSSLNTKGLRIPLPSIRVLWLTGIPAGTPDFPDRYSWLDANRRTDVVLLRNGDTVVGDIVTFNDKGQLRIKRTSDGSTVTLEPDAMAAVAFNPSLGGIRTIKGPYVRLTLDDGTRVCLVNPRADAASIAGASRFGTAVEIPVKNLVSLDVLQGQATFLSDLKPKKELIEPYSDLTWPWQVDRSVKHRPIQLRSKAGISTFDSGLGTHPKTSLVYALDGQFRIFSALVGLDAETGRRGRANVSILVDGKVRPIPELAALAATNGTVPVTIDVVGAKELMLVVDFGPGGDVQADVNWADAKLIK